MFRTQDIQIDDVNLRRQYYDYFLNGNVTQAQALYTSNPQLQGKVINADMLNGLLNGVLGLEGLYDTDVTQFLKNQLNAFQLSINELVYMNTYSPTFDYDINNFVIYNDEIYYCYAKPPIGTLPTNTTYWFKLGLKGKQGNTAISINYQGEWLGANSYNKYDMVTYNNNLYVAISDNTNKIPSTNPTIWLLAIEIIPQIIYVSETEPSGIMEGDVWWKIL